jgi:transcriptional regulator with XRE-family HTH domain
MISTTAITAVGRRIRHLREAQGLSRTDLARAIDVDVSSIAGWEGGKRLPREKFRMRLAGALDCDLTHLMSPRIESETPTAVSVLDVATEFPRVFAHCVRHTRRTLRAIRVALPSPTALNFQTEGRRIICDRLAAGTLEVQRVEIFYNLDRLKETLSNIIRFDGKPYYVKAHCIGLVEIAPFLGGFSFDDADVVLGAYWAANPPRDYPLLRIRGPAVQTFFLSYWREIWARGTLLNVHGSHDLSTVREVALKMGLPARQWPRFLEEARSLETGDGVPPII